MMPFAGDPREGMMAELEQLYGPDDMRIPKGQVNYRESTSQDMACASCANFIPDEPMCRIVEGAVSAGGVCDRWEAGERDDEMTDIE